MNLIKPEELERQHCANCLLIVVSYAIFGIEWHDSGSYNSDVSSRQIFMEYILPGIVKESP